MNELRWLASTFIAFVLCLVLVGFIASQSDQQDKQMCMDAGMRWEQTSEGIECR